MSALQLFSDLDRRSRTASVTLVKAVNTSGRIDEFLFTGEKRVASGAYFYMQIVF